MAQAVDFEAAFAELEELVRKMEAGSLTLEQSLAAFERGVELSRDCQEALRAAELRIEELTGDEAQEPVGQPHHAPQADDSDDDTPF